jgi:hypothetical protein
MATGQGCGVVAALSPLDPDRSDGASTPGDEMWASRRSRRTWRSRRLLSRGHRAAGRDSGPKAPMMDELTIYARKEASILVAQSENRRIRQNPFNP